MIEGVVSAVYEAVVRLTVQGPAGTAREIEAVIDTGFNGFLTLPPGLVAELALTLEGLGRATLGDGSEVTFPFYDVAVRWDGQMRYGLADAAASTPLVGMSLLRGYDLHIAVEPGGRVVVESR